MKLPRIDLPLPPGTGTGTRIVSNERVLRWTANFINLDVWISLAPFLAFNFWPHKLAG